MSQQESARRRNQSDKDPDANRQRYQLRGKYFKKWASDQWLADYYEVSRCTIWRWSKSGRLPPPERIGENCTRWDFERIQEEEQAA